MREEFLDCFDNIKNQPGIEIDSPPRGLMLGLGLTSKCNFNCPICFYHNNSGSKNNTELSLKTIAQILQSLDSLYLLNLSLLGEPLLHSEILDVLELAGSHSEHIILCSNGSIVSDRLCKLLGKLNGLNLILSLDAADAPTYSFMRRGGTFSTFIKNAKKFRDYLGDRLEFTCVLCGNNLESLKRLPELAASLGVKKITFNLLRETGFTRENGVSPVSSQELATFVAEIDERAKNLDLTITYPAPLNKRMCRLPFFYTSILSDGSLFPCCGDFKPEKIESFDYQGIFNHKYLASIRSNLISNKAMAACSHCHNHF